MPHPHRLPPTMPPPQADAARAAAREAYRADQRSEGKSAEWHTRVAEAQQVGKWREALRSAGRPLEGRQQLMLCSGSLACLLAPLHLLQSASCFLLHVCLQAHEALKEAREVLYRLQALAELLSKELQRRRSIAAVAGMGASSRRRSSSEAGAALTAAGGSRGAGAGGGAAASRSVQQIEERLLAPPATQGTKRKRGAPPEPCPFCGHCYTGAVGAACSGMQRFHGRNEAELLASMRASSACTAGGGLLAVHGIRFSTD